jgi:hypothetical protein
MGHLLLACATLLLCQLAYVNSFGATFCPANTCDSSGKCANGGNVAYTTDCRKFCMCTAGCRFNYEFSCGNNYFDATSNECSSNITVCGMRPTPSFNAADPCASDNFGLYKYNCTHYWWCAAKLFSGGADPVYACGPGTEWNQAIKGCSLPAQANCVDA